MRVLVAFSDEHRTYREAIAGAIRELRPSTEVLTTRAEAIPAELPWLAPSVVVCDRCAPGFTARDATWVTIPTNTARPAKISARGLSTEVYDLSLPHLLTVLDEAEVPPATAPSTRTYRPARRDRR